MRTDIDERRDEITIWLESGVSRMEVCRRLKCKYDTLKVRLDAWGLKHLKNQPGKDNPKYGARRPVKDYLKLDGLFIRSSRLRYKLIEEGVKDYRCEVCSNSEWLGGPIPLELHHENGNRFDNRLENLTIVCPNCHALTPTNSGKNIGSYS